MVMEISSVSALTAGMGASGAPDIVQLTVLRKAMDIKAQGALQLIQAASNIIPSRPPNLGNNIDTIA
jgi:hypothetical protein